MAPVWIKNQLFGRTAFQKIPNFGSGKEMKGGKALACHQIVNRAAQWLPVTVECMHPAIVAALAL
jgi:hypothetical protein